MCLYTKPKKLYKCKYCRAFFFKEDNYTSNMQLKEVVLIFLWENKSP